MITLISSKKLGVYSSPMVESFWQKNSLITFWTMPILIFSLAQIIMGHPLHHLEKEAEEWIVDLLDAQLGHSTHNRIYYLSMELS